MRGVFARPVLWFALAAFLLLIGYVTIVTWPLPLVLTADPEALDLGVEPTEADTIAALDGWVALQEQAPSEEVTFTDAELSALLSEDGPFTLPLRDVQVRTSDDGEVELSGRLTGTGPGTSVYAQGQVELVEGRWFTCRLASASVDGIEVPARYLEMAESYLADWANGELTRLGPEGIDVLRVEDGATTLSRRGDGGDGR